MGSIRVIHGWVLGAIGVAPSAAVAVDNLLGIVPVVDRGEQAAWPAQLNDWHQDQGTWSKPAPTEPISPLLRDGQVQSGLVVHPRHPSGLVCDVGRVRDVRNQRPKAR